MLNRLFQTIIGANKAHSSGASLDTMLNQMDRKLENVPSIVRPALTAKPRTPFDTNLPREAISMANLSTQQIAKLLPIMVPMQINMRRSARFYDGTFQPTRQYASAEFVQQLENVAYRLDAAAIRYVKVPTDAIFQHKGIPYQYAIIFTVEMAKEPLETAPSFEAMKEVVNGYKNLAVISNKLAHFLRKHGYGAYPGTAVGGLSDYAHLAESAGLGLIGYHGLLIAPENGARLRINTIYTNIENLPVQVENEHRWVRDFCAMCRKCIRKCPVNAIYDQPQPRGNGGMQCIDHATCRDYFQSHYGCAICLAVCPFSQIGYEKVQQRFKGNPAAPQYHIPQESVTVST
ncbi:MAG: reductive dehalogenase domain-containing protein [Chloroflexota bacterium]